MELNLDAGEAELLKIILLAELEEKRVELHHAKNIEFKAALVEREKILRGLLEKL